MASKNIWKTLAGLAVVGAAVGGVVAYVKNYRDHSSLDEEDFEELLDEEETKTEDPSEERSYTTLPTDENENPEKAPEEAPEKEEAPAEKTDK